MRSIGETTWVVMDGRIPSGYKQPPGRIPGSSDPRGRDGVLILNTGDEVVTVEVMLFFSAGDPTGPHTVAVPASSQRHWEFSELPGAAPMAVQTQFCAVLSSDHPIVVKHVQHSVHNGVGDTVSALAYAV